jgi:drug/metabolite transporter (DMT)-like permease
MPKKNACYIAMLVVGMLGTGSINTITVNMQMKMSSIGISGKEGTFSKPWFGTFNMMFAMMLVLFADALVSCICSKGKKGPGTAPLIDDAPVKAKRSSGQGDGQQVSYWKRVCLVSIGAAFDLFATAFSCIGIQFIPASVWQMLKGSALLFTGLFSVIVLKRKLYGFHCMGLLFCFTGVTVVGLASVLGSSAPDSSGPGQQPLGMVIFGMLIVLAGQVVQAAQVIAEEWLMKDLDLPAMQIIGWEGLWGVLMMVFLVYPLLWFVPGPDNGHQEDFEDTAVMLSNNMALSSCVIIYLASCSTFNVTGIAITQELSSVHRMMMDASRTLVIWLFDLGVHYFWDSESPYGEALTPYSGMQLVGFMILVLGQATYGEVFQLPCFKYPRRRDSDAAALASPGALMSGGVPCLPPDPEDVIMKGADGI